jgi:superfamily II DNA or RNA helicase
MTGGDTPVKRTYQDITDPLLKAATSKEEYDLHVAALEWDLRECIVLNGKKDIKSKESWQKVIKPYQHQLQNLFTFCRRLPATLLADDVGLGKTISAGLILSELMSRNRVERSLILCPKVLGDQWVAELETKFNITGVFATGEKLDAALCGKSSVVVTTYQSATSRLSKIAPDTFGMLILDEAHHLRNLYRDGKRNNAPQKAEKVRDALEKRLFAYVLMLTATPMQNSLWDLYSLIDYMTVAQGHQHPLGNPEEFRDRFLVPRSGGRSLKHERQADFRRTVQPYIVRTRRADVALAFPKREVRSEQVQLTPPVNALFNLVANHLQGLDILEQISLGQALMSSPRALATQLANMAESRPELAEAARLAREQADQCSVPAKLVRLLDLCERLRQAQPVHWRVVVFTIRRETQVTIQEALQRRGICFGLVSGQNAAENQKAITAFRSDPPGIHVLVSTDSGAEGVNLQKANVLVNYDLPWNPMVIEQRIGRIQRLGSEHATVQIYNLVAKDTVEEHVVARLLEKLQGVAQAVGDIESILEATNETASGDDAPDSFSEQIRQLVLNSLRKQDVEATLTQKENDLAAAKQLLEEQRAELDRTLGAPGDSAKQGPAVPKLKAPERSMGHKEFVKRAKIANGGVWEDLSPDLARVTTSGQVEHVAFTQEAREAQARQATFGGNVELYLPGKTAFEKLVQHWVERCGHHIQDRRGANTEGIRSTVQSDWNAKYPETRVNSTQLICTTSGITLNICILINANNRNDSYEKILDRTLTLNSQKIIPTNILPTDSCKAPIKLGSFISQHLNRVLQLVKDDRDINQFCEFYENRYDAEVEAAGADPSLKDKLGKNLLPTVHSEVVAFSGELVEVMEMEVLFTIDGHEYLEKLRIVPALNDLAYPQAERCAHTKKTVPASCLEECSITKQRVLKHLLGCSARSKRRALRSRMIRCEETKQLLHPDEVGLCQVTCKTVDATLLGVSTVSSKKALQKHLKRCAETGQLVLETELEQCQNTGKWVLPPQLETCSVSGRRLLSSEMETCAGTKKRVQRSDLEQCQNTDKWALPCHLETCQITGTRVLSSELETCAATGRRVLPSQLQTCSLTQKRMLPSEMETCAVTGKRAKRSELAQSDKSGHYALPSEICTCSWSRASILSTESTQCRWTGEPFYSEYVTDSKELLPLRELVEGHHSEAMPSDDRIPGLRRLGNPRVQSLRHVWVVHSGIHGRMAVCAEIQTGWIWRTTRYLGFLLQEDGGSMRILGRVICGIRGAEGWVQDEG